MNCLCCSHVHPIIMISSNDYYSSLLLASIVAYLRHSQWTCFHCFIRRCVCVRADFFGKMRYELFNGPNFSRRKNKKPQKPPTYNVYTHERRRRRRSRKKPKQTTVLCMVCSVQFIHRVRDTRFGLAAPQQQLSMVKVIHI